MGSISPIAGVRKRRDKRRSDRRADRKLRKKGPEAQFYGGSEEATEEARKRSQESVEKSEKGFDSATGRMEGSSDRSAQLEGDAEKDYKNARYAASQSRDSQKSAIKDINTSAQQANTLRSQALAANNLNTIADANIRQNQALAGQQLTNQTGILRRGALGMAAGAGEGGALGIQQALASSGAGAADLAAQTALQQNQLANDTRFNAANQQASNALAVGNANAGQLYDASGQVAAQTAALRGADMASQDAATGRQLNFLGQTNQANSNIGALALENQGQQLRNQQVINTAQLGADTLAAQNAYDAAKARNPFQKMMSTVFDPMDFRGSGQKGIV